MFSTRKRNRPTVDGFYVQSFGCFVTAHEQFFRFLAVCEVENFYWGVVAKVIGGIFLSAILPEF